MSLYARRRARQLDDHRPAAVASAERVFELLDEPEEIPDATAGVHSAAASDMYPPVRALPTHITSGLTPACPAANSEPVRPKLAVSLNASNDEQRHLAAGRPVQ